MSLLERTSARRRKVMKASSLGLTHPVGRHHPPITLLDMQITSLEEASSRRLDLFGSKGIPSLSAAISDNFEPNTDGGTGTCSDFLGNGAGSGKDKYCEPVL